MIPFGEQLDPGAGAALRMTEIEYSSLVEGEVPVPDWAFDGMFVHAANRLTPTDATSATDDSLARATRL